MSSKGDSSGSEQGTSNCAPASSFSELPSRSTNLTVRTSIDRFLQSTRASLKDAAKSARAKLAAKQEKRYAKQRDREIREIRSRLIGFSDEEKPKQLSLLIQKDQQEIGEQISEVAPEEPGERLLLLESFMKQLEKFNLKAQEFEVERITRGCEESGTKTLELALQAAQAEIDQRVRELEALNSAKVSAEAERQRTELALKSAQEDVGATVRELDAMRNANASIEAERQRTELALQEARQDVEAKARELDAVCRAKLRIEERQKQTELTLLIKKEEFKNQAQEVASQQKAKIRAEEELKRIEVELLRLKEESEKSTRELRAEKQARTRAEEEKKRAELVVVKTQKVVNKKEQEIAAEREARVKAEQELQRALAKAKTAVMPGLGLSGGEPEDSSKEEVEAEHEARVKAEQEWRQAQRKLLTVQDDFQRKSQQLEQERLDRIELQKELKSAQSSLIKAEAEAKTIANEIEAERRSRAEAEQQRRQLEATVLELQQEKESTAGEKETKQVGDQGEPERKISDEIEVRLEPKQSASSIRICPSCRRVFSASQEHCLFDATRLVDAPQMVSSVLTEKSKVLNWPILAVIIITFLSTGVVGSVAINYFSSGSNSAASQPPPVKRPETQFVDEPVVGGGLAGKAAYLARPEYPAAARNRGISGKVLVAVLVDGEGTVMQARAVEGEQLLRPPAVEAAWKTKFDTEKLVQQRGLTSGTITYNFQPMSQPQ